MKQPKNSTNAPVLPTPLNPHQFPLHAQMDATAGRDQVREVVPVHAPRQSKRPMERSAKKPDGCLISPCASSRKGAWSRFRPVAVTSPSD